MGGITGQIQQMSGRRYASYLARVLSVQSANMIQALPLADAGVTGVAADSSAGANPGCYFSGGLYVPGTLVFDEPGPAAGLKSVKFDGNDSGVDMVRQFAGGSNTFPADWNGNLFSAITWAKIDIAATWSDLTTARWMWHVRDGADPAYYATMGKINAVAHQISWRRRTGGAVVEQLYTWPIGQQPYLDWFCMGMTFDYNAGAPIAKFFLWDALLGFQKVGQSVSANLTDWGVHPPTAGSSVLAAGSLTLQEWSGWLALSVTWGAELTEYEIESAMTP